MKPQTGKLAKGYSHEKFKVGNFTVYKYTTEDSRRQFVHKQYSWLEAIQKLFPQYAFEELHFINDTETGYSMNRIIPKEMTKDNAKDLVNIVKEFYGLQLNKFSKHISYQLPIKLTGGCWEILDPSLSFENYVSYLRSIVLKNPDIFSNFNWPLYETRMLQYKEYANNHLSFYHGDLTIDNILWDGSKYTLIDPNYKTDMWPSHLLDLSKLYQETRFDNPELFNEIKKEISIAFNFDAYLMSFLDLLEIGHYIRMIPYVLQFRDIFRIKNERLNIIYNNIF